MMPLTQDDLLLLRQEAEAAAIHDRMVKLTSDQLRGLLRLLEDKDDELLEAERYIQTLESELDNGS